MLIDRLRRVTRDGRWVPEIDGLRFVAIGSVLLFHMAGELSERSGRMIPIEPRFWWMSRLLGNGDRGVALFFVISGMILAMPFARQMLLGGKSVSLRKFYLRRLTRLEPPYIASCLICLAIIMLYHNPRGPGFGSHSLASIFYQHSLIYGTMSPLNMVTWSLEVEIQFYVFAPLFMQVYRMRGKALRRSFLLAVIAVLGLAQIPFRLEPRFYLSILYYLQYFLAGLLVADIFVLDVDRIRSAWWWDAAGLAALGMFFWASRESLWAHSVAPLYLGLLVVAALRSVVLRRFFANPWIAVVGGMCYSIYLLHFIWIAALFKITRRAIIPAASFPVNLAIQMVVTVLPAVVLCAVFFVLVERPCMDPDWPSKLWHRLTGRPGREAAALDSAGVAEGRQ